MRKIASDISLLFIKENNGKTGLLIDESGWRKQGKKSVGVSRQYLGSIGKADNGQVGVFLSLVQADKVGIIDARLYLPCERTDDIKRCAEAGIPEEKIVFKTKGQLASEMISGAGKRGIRYDWVGGDGFYGHDSKLRYGLYDEGQFYVPDIHGDERVRAESPVLCVPDRTGCRGRKPTRHRCDKEGIRADLSVRDVCESEWKEYCFRNGTKGEKRRKVLIKEVWTWNGEDSYAGKEKLIVSKNSDGSDVKYSLCNDHENTYSESELLYMQMQRYWIERSFQDAKSELGMAEYQVRTWTAWHHHIALTMPALLFMIGQKIGNRKGLPLLSCSDIKLILANTLPKKMNTKQDILKIIDERHKRRKYDIDRFS
jgi:SRSO17 transposase